MTTKTITYPLDRLPEGAIPHGVTANPTTIEGKQAVRITLTDKVSKGKPHIDFIDMPTFLMIPTDFKNGTISVDLFSQLRKDAPDYARGFAGLAYRIDATQDFFEAVYLRPLNGLKVNPAPPRDQRAIQYFCYPEWKFDRLREEYPEGDFEAGAHIAPAEWINLRLNIDKNKLTVFVDDVECLSLDQTKAEETYGKIGLFVDIGTEAYFCNLKIETDLR